MYNMILQNLHMNTASLLSLVSDSDALRSHRKAAHGALIIPRTFTKTFGPRGFAVSGPTAWNALPPSSGPPIGGGRGGKCPGARRLLGARQGPQLTLSI